VGLDFYIPDFLKRRKVMKGFFKIIFVIVLMISSLSAEGKLFDLKEQYFSGTLVKEVDKKSFKTRYDVKKVEVDTNTELKDDAYINGHFEVQIKKENFLKKWNVNIRKKIGNLDYLGRTSLSISSTKGNTYFIVFVRDQGINGYTITSGAVYIDDKKIDKIGKLINEEFKINISKVDDKIIFKIGNLHSYIIEDKSFGKLAKVSVELKNHKESPDELSALSIYDAE
jgi:hypothetical protein